MRCEGNDGGDVVDGSFDTDTCYDAETAVSCESITFDGEADGPG